MKGDPRDKIFSLLVRERAFWRCERCDTQYSQHDARGLECAHIFSRRYRGTRWLPLNAVALCTRDHFHFTDNPFEFIGWVTAQIGDDNLRLLQSLALPICKLTKADLAGIRTNLKTSYARMKAARDSGAVGRLDFPSPYLERVADQARRVA